MIKNVVFDIGMVLISFSWRECLRECGVREEDFETIAEATVKSPYWNELDRGVMSDEEILDKFIESAPRFENEIRKFFSIVATSMPPFEYSKPWLHAVKERGYGVYILSNFSKNNFLAAKPDYTFLEEADGQVVSYVYNVIKPEPEIYKILFDKYDLRPEECVFIDDRADNIEMARALGMHGIVFTSYEDANRQLDELLKKEGAHG